MEQMISTKTKVWLCIFRVEKEEVFFGFFTIDAYILQYN